MTVRPVQARSLVAQASAELSRLIEAGEWRVGARIPNEQELSRLLGVGRSTSREAVRALIASGQLRSRHGSGTYVVSVKPVSDFDRHLLRSDVAQVYEVRLMLEVEAARLAARRRTEADIEVLKDALRQRESADEPAKVVEADLRLHAAVVAAAHNEVLSALYASFTGALRGAAEKVVGTPEFRDTVHRRHDEQSHARLIAAIESGDARSAAAAARRTMSSAIDAHLGAVTPF
ncbi:FadR family transcriptional regulator [Nocardia panacis]|uniref:FadR family transcriptional regulator n=1 Tax=Nocardia panacis TaxID=2340916 RepID=A0A3A4KDF9_9NOCA|nr:FCD domain-containing protein [Nocardia panacis]RJO70905.1 FadR family transcriptional regulator [Nocardia panacis]